MPRISPRALLEAFSIGKEAVILLPVCRTIAQAKRELNWIRQELPSNKRTRAIWSRSKFYPLQYVIGSQPFGNLDVICRRGTLIPRNDTEEWTIALAELIEDELDDKHLSVLDMCTGTGCIALLMSSTLRTKNIRMVGVDLSQAAVDLANINLDHNRHLIHGNITFCLGDLKTPDALRLCPEKKYDLIISNPPYIPPGEFNSKHGMEKSVRLFEPRLALEGDTEMFDALIENVVLRAEAKAFVFELAGIRQIEHVASLLDPDYWVVGYRFDMNGQYRNVIGWKKDSKFSFLSHLCTHVY